MLRLWCSAYYTNRDFYAVAREVKAIILFGAREKCRAIRESRPRNVIFSRSTLLTGFEYIKPMHGNRV